MTMDTLYMDNIDEYVNDENKIVTYKWLSLTLQVHCNIAKQMLYKFVEDQRNGKDDSNITVTYFVSGLAKKSQEDDYQMFKCAVVPEERLDTYKSTLEIVTSCHIYSVQKLRLKDSNALYMTDYEKLLEDINNCNKFSAIRNDDIKMRSDDEMNVLRPQFRAAPDNADKKVSGSTMTNGHSSSTASKKPVKPSGIAGMFAKQGKKTSPVKQEDQTEVKKAETKPVDKAKGKKPTGMMAFVSKQTGGKKSEPVVKEEKKKSPEVKKAEKADKGKTKKTARVADSDDDEVSTSKRRRIKEDLFASSEEEEEEEEHIEPESPTPPTEEPTPVPEPKGKKTPEPKPQVAEAVEEEEPIPKDTFKAKESEKGGNSGERRRKRVRKLVPKTYMGDDGYIVTEKHYESCSTDASESEEPIVTKVSAPKAPAPKEKKKASPAKSPGKKGSAVQTGGKQTSLMSFFKKK